MANTNDIFADNKFLDIYPQQYVLRQEGISQSIIIDRISGKLSKAVVPIPESNNKQQTIGIKGVYGIMQLQKAQYLIVATKSNIKDLDFILISRRDKRRAGLRFLSRGTDLDGNCSNFAEQEQIVVINTIVYEKELVNIYSYVQTRGSMPFKWRQTPTLKWAPKGFIEGDEQFNSKLCKKHFDDQQRYYTKQTMVNLVDKKGTQKTLGTYFEKMIASQNNPDLKYVWFDFHHECRKMKYENLSILLGLCKEELSNYGFFHIQYHKNKPSELNQYSQQVGVLRTNCMDCLDRTNVVQSVFARQLLHEILHKAQILDSPNGDPFQKFPDKLEETFRAVWTRNADVMSILYSGTGALKTDFTRTGKRTKQGALQDGKNSIQRYFLNNFYDAHKQNSYSVLNGDLDVQTVKYQQPLINPLFLLCITIVGGLYFINHFTNTVINPYLADEVNMVQQGVEQFQEKLNFKQQIASFLTIGFGLYVVLNMLQKANHIFVPKPEIKH
ncbi:hypothetical protein PPERSA_07661 [Pseudocohnilembus persalinus]|uniref:SAC domain-containing protein n=1 Tax=Pseudocohnilembus persalinus TaxID=266149 RepID=A0A0V0QJ24_PSEPJ|nr:hypothetical protein PPERSA_07661 [Pseudocohnilembus persalinus]|eukprot:KRX02016.1 hypothetical protein PPERSA_07661 [Pseudocohnilembus persalinus]